MQWVAATLMFACCIVSSVKGEAAYIIKLKNGNEFITGRYWQEGKQVLFDTYDGVFGVDRAFVVKVEESDKPLKLVSVVQETPEEKPRSASDKDEAKTASSPTEQKADVKRDGDPILKEFNALKERSNGVSGMLTSELLEFSKDVQNFKRRIQLSGKSNDYLQEYAAAFKMADEVQAALNARRQ